MTFLKIISFPIRLVLSLAFNIIAIVLIGINFSVIQFVKIASLFIMGAASIIFGIAAVGLLIAVIWAGLGIKNGLTNGAILAVLYLLCMFVPMAAETIEKFLFFAADKSKSLASVFLTCRKYS